MIEEFKKDKSAILVTTIRCLAEGYNLDCCDNIIMTDIDWNFGVNKQFQNRIHRLTSTRSKNYYMIIVSNTVNEYKYKKIMNEKINAEIALNDSKENIILKILNDYRKDMHNGSI
jgi:SNF2 family DNA or RNA helicase